MTSSTSRSQRSSGAWSSRNWRTSRSGCSGNFLAFSFSASIFLPLLLEVLLGVDEGLHVVLRRAGAGSRSPSRSSSSAARLGRRPRERRVRVDEVLEAEAVVDELLDLVDPLPRHVRAGCASRGWPSCRSSGGSGRSCSGACTGSTVRPPVSRSVERKQKLFLKKSTCAVDVRHDELLVDERVSLEQVGVRGVVVDDHLVDLREAVLVALGEPLVLHAEAPVRVAVREAAVRRDLVHLVVGEDLEDGREEVEARRRRELLDPLLLLAQVRGQRGLQRELAHVSSLPLAEELLDATRRWRPCRGSRS